MKSVRHGCLALCCGVVLSVVGCCYHVQNFGRTRDVGLGEIGCDSCYSCPPEEPQATPLAMPSKKENPARAPSAAPIPKLPPLPSQPTAENSNRPLSAVPSAPSAPATLSAPIPKLPPLTR